MRTFVGWVERSEAQHLAGNVGLHFIQPNLRLLHQRLVANQTSQGIERETVTSANGGEGVSAGGTSSTWRTSGLGVSGCDGGGAFTCTGSGFGWTFCQYKNAASALPNKRIEKTAINIFLFTDWSLLLRRLILTE